MKLKRVATTLALAGLLGVGVPSVWAHEQKPPLAVQPARPEIEPQSQLALDPVMRALLIAMAARMLREAAASPDPLGTLAQSLERTVESALANPETMRMVEALTGQALREMPEELRQALVSFAASMLAQMRRDMLDKRRSGP